MENNVISSIYSIVFNKPKAYLNFGQGRVYFLYRFKCFYL